MFQFRNPSWWLTLAGIIGSYFATFQTNLSGGAKGGIGAAVLGLIATYVHEHHATVRNETTAAASLGHAPVQAPSASQVASIAKQVMADLGGHSTTPPAPQVAPPSS